MKLKISEKRWKDFLSNLRLGLTILDSAILIGSSADVIYDKKRRDPKFAQDMEEAILSSKKQSLRVVHTAGKQQWQASAWYLERKFAQEYSLRNKVEVTGVDGNPLQHQAIQFGNLSSKDLIELSRLLSEHERKRDTGESATQDGAQVPG
jgi:hypothetical protein